MKPFGQWMNDMAKDAKAANEANEPMVVTEYKAQYDAEPVPHALRHTQNILVECWSCGMGFYTEVDDAMLMNVDDSTRWYCGCASCQQCRKDNHDGDC